MKEMKFLFKIIAAIFVVSAAVSAVFIFRTELTQMVSSMKMKIDEKRKCDCDFVDFDDV